MVYRIYVEKKPELAFEAKALESEIRDILNIPSVTGVRVINRYDADNLSEELFAHAVWTVFAEPQTDIATKALVAQGTAFAVEYLPGQFDQRADSAAQCIQIISQGEKPRVRSAKVYVLEGSPSAEEVERIKKHLINPVEAREAGFALPETLAEKFDTPEEVETLQGFTALDHKGLEAFVKQYGLAMDVDDITVCRDYFASEHRDPTITEIRMIDTYWSDHCRHTTFLTTIDEAVFEDPALQKAWEDYMAARRELGREAKPVCMMDLATIAAKALKAAGKMDKLDESKEINACTVKIEIEADGVKEPWLLLFKNETHNHPTEIEPFGGAATCIGGAIRDPLSGRAYVYGAMRLTGAADPTVPVEQTIPGKLPQRKIVTTAAAGYSSYGNQIGLATGMVDELYHPGYAAKRMEVGAVIAAAPAENVRREEPEPGDVVILLGGATGRDGIGGATGSSKAHDSHSVEKSGAEVQKGNAPEERKMQRLFKNGEATRLIKRCNDFGAGGVSVAIGELADGLSIDLDKVPKKYEGLDGTELAISESQERMAVVVAPEDAARFIALSEKENLSATPVAVVTEEPRLTMRWKGKVILDLSREFLNSNGAEKHIRIKANDPQPWQKEITGSFAQNFRALAEDLNICDKRGLSERFDSTVGGRTVLMPFGGKNQLTPIQAMVHRLPEDIKKTDDCSFMAWGFDPFISEKSPYHGAYLAVFSSVAKLIAAGADIKDTYLSFQEYFEKPGTDGTRWGKPLSALLGAFEAQMGLGIGAIGGKDSMSGSFEKLDVPPTLISFAVTMGKVNEVISPEFKLPDRSRPVNTVVQLLPEYDESGLPTAESFIKVCSQVTELMRTGQVLAAWTPTMGGVAEGILKMCLGNGYGFRFQKDLTPEQIFGYSYGSFLLELAEGTGIPEGALRIGSVTEAPGFLWGDDCVAYSDLFSRYENRLESVFVNNIPNSGLPMKNFTYKAESWPVCSTKFAKPRVLIPAFPGTNCEMDSAHAIREAGGEPEVFVVRNYSADAIRGSVEEFAEKIKQSQVIFIPGGFSGGDEPDGSGKFITAFFRNPAIKDGVTELLDSREGLMCGICNGFQALIKLGLVPYGRILDMDETMPTLTFNTIARHQSKIVRTRVASNKSPWLALADMDEIYNVAVSHGEGRFLASEEVVAKLAANGQICTQYVDMAGNATGEIQFNPNDSVYAIEGITSPDGRVLGKMGHNERYYPGLYRNVPGNYDMHLFEAAMKYFK